MDLFVTDSETAVTDALQEYPTIPATTIKALHRYVANKLRTGDFLYAVLTNNLFEATSRADQFNRTALFDICMFIYNEIPSPAWGSKEKVEAWLKSK